MKIWLSACKLSLVLVSFSLLLSNSLLLANSAPSSSLHQPKILCHDQEKYALLHFKQSFSIDCGKSYPVVAYSKMKMWPELDHVGIANRVDCCRWDGVTCNKESGHVIGLDLSSSCLYGNFPLNSTIFGLDHLSELNLADNNFNYSQIPSEIGRLNKLIYLNLSLSAFSGQIPAEMTKLSSLSYLDLSDNGDFLGANGQYSLKLHDLCLEKLLTNLTQITQLFLGRVDILSTVPLVVGNRTSLQAISLHDCNLFGKIPPNFFTLPNLKEVELYSNLNLRGDFPEFPSDSPLRYLLLSQTKFAGRLPHSLGNLASLKILDLEMCYFTGTIPFSLGNLSKLTTLSLSYNHLRGDFPSSLMNLTGLTTLSLSDIKILDFVNLKSWLLKLSKLTQLDLHRMNLNDEILPILANLTSLTHLDLKDNQLTTPLSHWLVNLTQLNTLNLRGNQFQGTIPPWLPYFVNLGTLYISFKGSRGEFDPFLKLPNLHSLYLSGLTLSFPSNIRVNSSVLSLRYLGIESCNLTEFPTFLRNQKDLQEVSLSQNNIAGDIPQWFVNITRESLFVLDLSDNLLTGFERPQMILPWDYLEVLYLDGNKFRGHVMIPTSSIQVYQVKHNQFSGAIPKEICCASSLIFLDFSENFLGGQIPNCISHQLGDSLQVLNLQGNSFDGTMPNTFSKSCKLKLINLSQNQLKGELAKSLVNCSMLEVLNVGKNHINDTFPSWFEIHSRLQVLVLSHNQFHGKIENPKLDHSFPCLRIIDLSYNFHIGDLPSSYIQSWSAMQCSDEDESDSSMSTIRIYIDFLGVFYSTDIPYHYGITITNKGSEIFYSSILTVFRVVDFSHNFFSGAITEAISELRGLQALNLSNNNLVGSIPSSLANMNELESLDLSQNMLSGEIPQTLAKLTSLEVFNVSHNRLVGPIPQGEQFNTFDDSSFQGNLALCGFPLPEKCGNKDFPPESAPTQETEDNSMWIDWLVRSLGCASGFVIGFVIGKIFITDKHHDWFIDAFGRRKWPKTRARPRSAPRGPRNS